MKKVLLVEDDKDLLNVIKCFLELNNYDVTTAENGENALEIFKSFTFDICIFDVMMPKFDGFSLAQKTIEINSETPFIFLTAKSLSEDKIKGLKLGADDYIVKPFEAEELILRINNIIKRKENRYSNITKEELNIGEYIFNTKRLVLIFKNEIQQLTEKEAMLIHYLYIHKNQLLKREQILKAIWKSDDFFSGRSMDVYISKIRKHFAKDKKISIECKRFIGLEFKIKE